MDFHLSGSMLAGVFLEFRAALEVTASPWRWATLVGPRAPETRRSAFGRELGSGEVSVGWTSRLVGRSNIESSRETGPGLT